MDIENKSMMSLIFGIVSLIFMFLPVPALSLVGIILAIIGLVFGKQVKKSGFDNGKAKAGRVLCWIGLILCIIAVIVAVVLVGALISATR